MPKKAKKEAEPFTSYHAAQVVDMHEIEAILGDAEEVDGLERHNPELLEAYRALVAYARSE